MGHLARLWGDPPAPRLRPSRRVEADLTFRRLLGDAWQCLPPAVRARFAVKPAKGASLRFAGRIDLAASPWARLFARLCRLIGGPLPWRVGRDVPATIELRTLADGAVSWERTYRFGAALVRARSAKVAGGSEILERIGGGFEMRERLSADACGLHVDVVGYRWRRGRFVLPWPVALTPGRLRVSHIDVDGTRFRFTLVAIHPLLGESLRQDGVFAAEPEE